MGKGKRRTGKSTPARSATSTPARATSPSSALVTPKQITVLEKENIIDASTISSDARPIISSLIEHSPAAAKTEKKTENNSESKTDSSLPPLKVAINEDDQKKGDEVSLTPPSTQQTPPSSTAASTSTMSVAKSEEKKDNETEIKAVETPSRKSKKQRQMEEKQKREQQEENERKRKESEEEQRKKEQQEAEEKRKKEEQEAEEKRKKKEEEELQEKERKRKEEQEKQEQKEKEQMHSHKRRGQDDEAKSTEKAKPVEEENKPREASSSSSLSLSSSSSSSSTFSSSSLSPLSSSSSTLSDSAALLASFSSSSFLSPSLSSSSSPTAMTAALTRIPTIDEILSSKEKTIRRPPLIPDELLEDDRLPLFGYFICFAFYILQALAAFLLFREDHDADMAALFLLLLFHGIHACACSFPSMQPYYSDAMHECVECVLIPLGLSMPFSMAHSLKANYPGLRVGLFAIHVGTVRIFSLLLCAISMGFLLIREYGKKSSREGPSFRISFLAEVFYTSLYVAFSVMLAFELRWEWLVYGSLVMSVTLATLQPYLDVGRLLFYCSVLVTRLRFSFPFNTPIFT
eukprot:TRINITY_DN514_c0_g4_i2.p1 TRINITY_DN514_c0_g4~~TRINITY_DN514_c0_g4_i2.p1  ORF type:complete len:575 (-),score=202.96 TRINITY_DN514_c0_g4_i2:239-1963(-)